MESTKILQTFADFFQICAESIPDFWMAQCHLDRGLHNSQLVAHVIASTGKIHSNHPFAAGHSAHCVSQLDFTASAGLRVVQNIKNIGCKDATPQDREQG